jgi:nucleoside-diphosphate-sugar epimerase
MKVLVTGGKGFIGSHLVNYLKEKGHWVRSVDVKADAFLKTKEDEFILADLTNPEAAIKVTENIDWVFNLAANMGGIGFIAKVKADVMRDNVRINTNILEGCRVNGVKRLFFSSSACVYPQNLQLNPGVAPLKESDAYPAYPDSAYGWEKLFTELMMKSYHEDYGLDIRIARLHNIYGPYGTYKGGREKAPAALCRKVAEAEDGGTITIWGDGKQTRSFLYIDDALEAIYKLMESSYTEPLNIGSDELISIDELADIIIKISGKNLKKTYDLSAPQGVRGRNADLTLIKKVIGWEPKTSYREGLEKTYYWISKMVERYKHG